jgi:hypothetical protein
LHNQFGSADGQDLTFTTLAAGGRTTSALPDGRAYELVSSLANGDEEVYVPASGHELVTKGEPSGHEIFSGLPVRAAANRDAVAYVAGPPPSGGSGSVGDGFGNDFLAARRANGWSATDISPSSGNFEAYQGFSDDLALSFLTEQALTPQGPRNCEGLYSRETASGAYHALFVTEEAACESHVAGVSSDDAAIVFESTAALSPGAVPGISGSPLSDTYNIYESFGGQVYPVNVLPHGPQVVNSAVGGVSPVGEEVKEPGVKQAPGYNHYGQAVSADGSRVVWTDLNTGDLYVREDPTSPDASTVQVDAAVGGGGYYRGASDDGSEVFFTKTGDLYEYDLNTATTSDLTPVGGVLGVAGVSEDGSTVYFVAEHVLANNENANREKAAEGAPNLYVRIEGTTRFIARLSPQDNAMLGPAAGGGNGFELWGDWRTGLKNRTAEVAPDGQHLVFMSRRSLTGYDNIGGCVVHDAEVAEEGRPEEPAGGCFEVYVYNAATGELFCTSCNPTGEPPVAATGPPSSERRARWGGAFLPTVDQTASGAYQLRWISTDGDRVFFDTAEPLVAQDTNGVQDVYEWERPGEGSCTQQAATAVTGGCTYLISSNLSGEEAYFLDASASGDDVFFTSRAQLAPQDDTEYVEVYDARVGGGFPQVATECTGAGCQGVPPPPAGFATPPSVTFAGTGNFPPPMTKSPAKPTAETRAQKLAKALRSCRKDRVRRRRAVCERQAHKRYGGQAKSKGRR